MERRQFPKLALILLAFLYGYAGGSKAAQAIAGKTSGGIAEAETEAETSG